MTYRAPVAVGANKLVDVQIFIQRPNQLIANRSDNT